MFQKWKDVEKHHVEKTLILLKDFYSTKDNWIEWPIAVNAVGHAVSPLSSEAVKWALMGASLKLATENFPSPLCNFIDCATRDYLKFLSDDKILLERTSYEDEYIWICLALEDIANLT